MSIGHFPEHIDPVEARIINRLLTEALKDGGRVAVFDGYEWAIKHPTRDRAAIQREVAATDHTWLFLYRKDAGAGDAYAKLWLVHGNGEDVFADIHAQDEATMAEVERRFTHTKED